MYLILLSLLITGASFAQDAQEIQLKIKDIEKEITKTSRYIDSGDAKGIFKQHLEKLNKEKSQYEKLLRQVTKQNVKKTEPPREDPNSRKILPSVVRRDLEEYKAWQDENIPVEKRYDLILVEMSNLFEMNSRLSTLDSADEQVKQVIQENNKKIAELERLKIDYEIKMREIEDSEFSEQKKAGVRVGMMADIYYQWDFNRPRRNSDGAPEIPYKNYTSRHNDLTINLLEINVSKSYKRIDAYADIDFGEQPEQNKSHSSDAIATHLGQAFLRYRPQMLSDVSITAGKFYSHFGYEVSKNIENRTYSRPFYYTLVCPFWHEGVSVNKSNLGPFSISGYIYDRTDDRVDNNSGKTYGLQLAMTLEKFNATYNAISGAEANSAGNTSEGNLKTQHELILSYQATDRLTLISDAVIGSNKEYDADTGKDLSWSALVGYADYKTSPLNSLGLRVENFRDLTSSSATNNLFTTTSNSSVKPPSVMGYTLTDRYSLGNGAEIRAELRYDNSNKEIFPGHTKNKFMKEQTTFSLGWLYSI